MFREGRDFFRQLGAAAVADGTAGLQTGVAAMLNGFSVGENAQSPANAPSGDLASRNLLSVMRDGSDHVSRAGLTQLNQDS